MPFCVTLVAKPECAIHLVPYLFGSNIPIGTSLFPSSPFAMFGATTNEDMLKVAVVNVLGDFRHHKIVQDVTIVVVEDNFWPNV